MNQIHEVYGTPKSAFDNEGERVHVELNSLLLKDSQRIADELLAKAIEDEDGMRWSTISIDSHHNLVPAEGFDIYSGSTGIALFLMELSVKTKSEKYLDAAKKAMKWSAKRALSLQMGTYSLFTGHFGVCYGLKRLSEIDASSQHQELALQIVWSYEKSQQSHSNVMDLLNGHAGILLGLLHLHEWTGNASVLGMIESTTKTIIDSVRRGQQGLCWDRNRRQIHALCGFSHGASGIGWVLDELGKYVKNDAFSWLSQQAFNYEDQYFSEENRNWPDFRKMIRTDDDKQKFRQAYTNGDKEFFLEPTFLNAWCHGAAGIGLARLRFLGPTRNLVEDLTIRRVVEKCTQDISRIVDRQSFTLCHGAAGLGEFFLELFRISRDNSYLVICQNLAAKMLDDWSRTKCYRSGYPAEYPREDVSLFMGNAGIGYFYLRVMDQDGVRSILAPSISRTIDQQSATNLNECLRGSRMDLKHRVLQRIYPLTFESIRASRVGHLRDVFESSVGSEFPPQSNNLIRSIRETFSRIDQEECESIEKACRIDIQRVSVDLQVESDALLNAAELIKSELAEEILGLDESAFIKQKLIVDPRAKIIETSLRSDVISGVIGPRTGPSVNSSHEEWEYFLIQPLPEGTRLVVLSRLTCRLFELLKQQNSVGSALDQLVLESACNSESMERTVRAISIEQIRGALQAGLLVTRDYVNI